MRFTDAVAPPFPAGVDAAMRRLACAVGVLGEQLVHPCPGCGARRWAISDRSGVLHLQCRGCGWSAYHVDDCADSADEPSAPLPQGDRPWPSFAGTRRPT